MKNFEIKFSEDKDDFGIILEYLNFKEKLITPLPRTVIFQKSLIQKLIIRFLSLKLKNLYIILKIYLKKEVILIII